MAPVVALEVRLWAACSGEWVRVSMECLSFIGKNAGARLSGMAVWILLYLQQLYMQ